MQTNENYGYKPMAANATGIIIPNGGSLGGFACTTSGSLKLTETSGAGTTVVDTMPVVAGNFYTLPFQIAPGVPLFAALTGGAAGTFAII